MAGVLFEDIFDVKDIDPDGKKFERGTCYIWYIALQCISICSEVLPVVLSVDST